MAKISVGRHSTRRSKFTQPPLPENVAKALEKLQEEQFREEQRLARAMRMLERSYIVCPGCLEHLPRDGSTILLHSRSGCGEIIAIQKLWGVIKRERQASPQGPDWIPAKSLLAEIERVIGKPDWAVEAAIDDLTLDMEDVSLGGPSGSK